MNIKFLKTNNTFNNASSKFSHRTPYGFILLLTIIIFNSPIYSSISFSQPFDPNAGSSAEDFVKAGKNAAAKNNIFIIDDFSGGLNSKQSPFTLPKSQADIAENVRYDTQLKALSKRDKVLVYGTASASAPILGLHRFYLADGTKVLLTDYSNKIAKGNDTTGVFTDILTLTSSDRRAQWLTWHNIAIMTDGYNQPVKYDGTSASATYLGSALAVDAGSGAGPNGTYTYKVSCYTASYNLNLGVASNTIVVSDNDINLSMIPICPDTYLGQAVVGRKIYRTGNGDSTYKLLSNGTIANNTAVTLTDSDADGDRGNLLTSDVTTTSPVPKGRLILVSANRLWIANDPDHPSRLYYSEDSEHEVFLPTSYLDIRQNDGDEITGIANVLGKLTVLKTNTIQKVYTDGDPSTDWEISDPFTHVGCHAMYSVADTPNGLIYLSNNGLYIFSGQYSELISDAVTPEIKDISSSNIEKTWGAYYKNSYSLAYTSSKSGGTVNNRVLVLDLLSKAFSIDTLSINAFTVLKGGSDVEILYSGGSASGKVYAHSDSTKEIIHRRHSDFTGTFTEMRYIPTDADGDAESPVLELSRTATIDALVGTIDSLTGTIDRSSLTGNYISQPLTVGASRYDKIYWNETSPTSGSNVTFAVRSAATVDSLGAGPWIAWSSEYSDPSGSDISANTANAVIQYRASLTTDDLSFTPTIYKANNFNIKLTYNIAGATDETAVGMRWHSGWLDLGLPGRKKQLRKMYIRYDSASTGTLNFNLSTYDGHSDSYAIDLTTYPSEYVEYFHEGSFLGELFLLDITESSLNAFKIKSIILVFDVEPLV